MLAVAELAGADWPERARKAAESIAGKVEGSQGSRLFMAFYALCVAKLKAGATELVIPSEEAVAFLKDFDPYWATDYRASDGRPGEITKNKLAALLRGYEIYPEKIHPTNGYVIFKKGEWRERWLDMFARYAPKMSGCPEVGAPETEVTGARHGQRTGADPTVSIRWIMGDPAFERGVRDARARRAFPADFDTWETDPAWNYERGRVWAQRVPTSIEVKRNGRVTDEAERWFARFSRDIL